MYFEFFELPSVCKSSIVYLLWYFVGITPFHFLEFPEKVEEVPTFEQKKRWRFIKGTMNALNI